jgi:hypothetical protein
MLLVVNTAAMRRILRSIIGSPRGVAKDHYFRKPMLATLALADASPCSLDSTNQLQREQDVRRAADSAGGVVPRSLGPYVNNVAVRQQIHAVRLTCSNANVPFGTTPCSDQRVHDIVYILKAICSSHFL